MTEMPAGAVTFLFTDIVGSTRLWERDHEAMSDALVRHDRLVKRAIEGCRGMVFKTVGDAFCAVFDRPYDAIDAAIAVQRSIAGETWRQTTQIRVRVALHMGPAEERDGDYFGRTLNRCARIESLAQGGQVLVSRATADQVLDKLPEGASLRDLGEHLYATVRI